MKTITPNVECQLQGVTGGRLNVDGTVQMYVERTQCRNRESIVINACVVAGCEFAGDILIGIDTLGEYKGLLDLSKETAIFFSKEKQMRSTVWEYRSAKLNNCSGRHRCSAVEQGARRATLSNVNNISNRFTGWESREHDYNTPESVMVHARSDELVHANELCCTYGHARCRDGIYIVNKRKCGRHGCIMNAESLVNIIDGKVPLAILNLTAESVTMLSGKHIASMQKVDECSLHTEPLN